MDLVTDLAMLRVMGSELDSDSDSELDSDLVLDSDSELGSGLVPESDSELEPVLALESDLGLESAAVQFRLALQVRVRALLRGSSHQF
jgi:hypothetical protein